MSEQTPMPQSEKQPDNYLTEHPNAVVDPVKALIMAYGSKSQEERVVAHRKDALEAASHMGEGNDWQSKANHGYGAIGAAVNSLQAAVLARQEADKHAQAAAAVYDRVHKL